MANEDLGERSEDATPKRRKDSRNEGQVAKSQDLAGAVLLIAGTIAIALTTSWMLGEGARMFAAVLDGDLVSDPLDPDTVQATVMLVGAAAARIAAPVLLVLWGAGFLAHFVQIGWLFVPGQVRPRASKLNPLSGFKRIFGIQGIVKASIDSVKVVIVILIAVLTVRQHIDQIFILPYLTVLESLATIGRLLIDLALRLLAVLLVLGLIDLTWQKVKHSKDLKMTKQQVKDEMKQTDGDPETKRRRMRIQQQIAMQRVGAAVPKADVIVTNPEHISIAIKYDDERMRAPTVIAKGADHLALRIRQLAVKHGVPIVERKPLARALYRQVAVGQEIPPDFYAAIAEVLAFVYRLNGRMAG